MIIVDVERLTNQTVGVLIDMARWAKCAKCGDWIPWGQVMCSRCAKL